MTLSPSHTSLRRGTTNDTQSTSSAPESDAKWQFNANVLKRNRHKNQKQLLTMMAM